ncbi:unnamed protein product, partial [Musa banksii]
KIFPRLLADDISGGSQRNQLGLPQKLILQLFLWYFQSLDGLSSHKDVPALLLLF